MDGFKSLPHCHVIKKQINQCETKEAFDQLINQYFNQIIAERNIKTLG